MSWMAVAAVASVASVAITGYSAYNQNKGMAEQAEADGKAQLARGRLEAERIRKEKEKAQSTARAALAGNGLDVNEGTSIVINDEIERSGNYDANMAEITGYNTSQQLKAAASQYSSNANAAAAAGVANSISAVGSYKGKRAETALAAKGNTSNSTSGGWK